MQARLNPNKNIETEEIARKREKEGLHDLFQGDDPIKHQRKQAQIPSAKQAKLNPNESIHIEEIAETIIAVEQELIY